MGPNKIGRSGGVVVKEGKVLLMWRFRNNEEYYVVPGGGIEEGESVEVALEREIFEELNLKIKSYKKFFEFENSYTSSHNEPRKDYYFIIPEFEGEIKIGDPELSLQSRNNIYRPEWIEIDEVKKTKIMPEDAKIALVKYLEENKI